MIAAETGAQRLVAEVGFTDGFGADDLFWWAAGLATTLGLLRLILAPVIKRLDREQDMRVEFRRAWYGEPAVPGRDAVPGIPERINRMDGELQRNGGSSLKDAVFETKRLAEDIMLRLDQGDLMRTAILAATEQNMHATRDAFKKAGLEPPEYTPIPVIIEPPHEPH
jgi:hypothetical protein